MKVVFLLSISINPNSIKRVNEFIDRGYDVEAYGFMRNIDAKNTSDKTTIETIGTFSNSTSYFGRVPVIYKGVRDVLRKTEEQKCLYYLIGLDVALAFRLQSDKPYIFEEADITHANIRNALLRNIYEYLDKKVIKKSVMSVFRSEGFPRYHFGDNIPDNVHVIANRLNVKILDVPVEKKKEQSADSIAFGFVGFIRYSSIYNFAKVLCSKYPQHEMHFYGTFSNKKNETKFESLKAYKNCFFHGSFKSPDELPKIYSNIDLVLSTYDVSSANVRYAEPNKIYEAIYFETPIIVSSGTFLADKVNKLHIGYDINAMDEQSIVNFVDSLSSEGIKKKQKEIREIDKKYTININDDFFEKLELKLRDYKE